MDRRRFLPTYHYEDNTDGVLLESVGKPLRDYKVYGNSEPVGDKSVNLCPYAEKQVIKNSTWAYGNLGKIELEPGWYSICCDFVQNGTLTKVALSIRDYDVLASAIKEVTSTESSGKLFATFQVPENAKGIQILLYSNSSSSAIESDATFTNIFLERGYKANVNAMSEYEPYGYKVPIKVTGTETTTTNIYITEPLGANEYIDYKKQSIIRDTKTEPIELPTIPTAKGIVNIIVGTDIKPSGAVWQYYRE